MPATLSPASASASLSPSHSPSASPPRAVVTLKGPQLYPKQWAAIFAPTRYAEIEAASKSGKTLGCLCWFLDQACKAKPGQHVWWIAPWYPTAEIAFRRARWALPPQYCKINESRLSIELANGVTLWFKSGEKPDGLYGEDVVAAVMDEASRMREEAWHAVRSTLTHTQGPVRMIGNVKGRRNWFWQLCREAETGLADHTYSRLTWRDAVEGGVMRAAEIEDARRVLPPHVFQELYEATAASDGGNPFGLEAIEAATGPMSTAAPRWWGWDLAKSTDWTWGVALDAQGYVCRSVRFQAPWEETTRRILAVTGTTAAYVDSTGVGDPIVEQLARRAPNIAGYKFTATSKQQLMEGLALAFQQQTIHGLPRELAAECETFEYEYTRGGCRYSAPPNLHDDGVCALALAQAKRVTYAPPGIFVL